MITFFFRHKTTIGQDSLPHFTWILVSCMNSFVQYRILTLDSCLLHFASCSLITVCRTFAIKLYVSVLFFYFRNMGTVSYNNIGCHVLRIPGNRSIRWNKLTIAKYRGLHNLQQTAPWTDSNCSAPTRRQMYSIMKFGHYVTSAHWSLARNRVTPRVTQQKFHRIFRMHMQLLYIFCLSLFWRFTVTTKVVLRLHLPQSL